MRRNMHWRRVGSWLVPLLAVLSTGAARPELPLIEAIKRADTKAVRALLQQRMDVNIAEEDGTTALHWAANREDLGTVNLLIDAGANVKATNRYGVTPLAVACTRGNAAIIERLLKAGTDPNASLPGGETALMTAARTGIADAMNVLLAYGADVNAREGTRGQTALMWAAAEGNAAAIRTLIEAGADIHARSSERNFRKQTASYTGGAVDQGAPIEFTALLFAVRAGEIEAARALLDAGANVNETVSDGTSALVVAISNAHYELATILLDKGAATNAAAQGWTALHQLARTRALNVGHLPPPVPTGTVSGLALAKSLIAHGANVNARVTKTVMDAYRGGFHFVGATPLLLAAKGVDFELMRVLLANGADPLLMNSIHTTPLLAAAGVEVSRPGEDSGTNEDALEAFKVALEAGGDVNAVNDEGDSPLHGAALRGANPIVQILVDRGAKLSVKNRRGWTPLSIASGTFKGKSIYIADTKQPQTEALLRQLMKDRGVPIGPDDDPANAASDAQAR